MRLLSYLILICVIVSILVIAHEQTSDAIGDTFALKVRQRRASSNTTSTLTYTGCGHWSDWISRNTPSRSSSNEIEYFTKADLETLCPTASGNQVKDFRCRDEKGEAIHDIFNKTDVSNLYIFTCNNMSATCNVITTAVTGDRCPDYAIRIKCECPPTTTTTSTTAIPTTTSRYVTVAASTTRPDGTAIINVTNGSKDTTVNLASTASAIFGGSTMTASGITQISSGSWSGYVNGTGTIGYVSTAGLGRHGNGSTIGNATVHGFTSVDSNSQTRSGILNWLIPVIAGTGFLAAFLVLLL